MTEKQTFEGWAIVELFGHQQIAGLLSEQSIGGAAFVRVDVPQVGDNPGFTKFFGGSAVYAITPTTEEVATVAAGKLEIRPVSPWIVPVAKQLPGPVVEGHDEDYDYEDEELRF